MQFVFLSNGSEETGLDTKTLNSVRTEYFLDKVDELWKVNWQTGKPSSDEMAISIKQLH